MFLESDVGCSIFRSLCVDKMSQLLMDFRIFKTEFTSLSLDQLVSITDIFCLYNLLYPKHYSVLISNLPPEQLLGEKNFIRNYWFISLAKGNISKSSNTFGTRCEIFGKNCFVLILPNKGDECIHANSSTNQMCNKSVIFCSIFVGILMCCEDILPHRWHITRPISNRWKVYLAFFSLIPSYVWVLSRVS